jgi:hypothetical protein
VASVIASGTVGGYGSEEAYVASFIVVGVVCLLAIVASVTVPNDRPVSSLRPSVAGIDRGVHVVVSGRVRKDQRSP